MNWRRANPWTRYCGPSPEISNAARNAGGVERRFATGFGRGLAAKPTPSRRSVGSLVKHPGSPKHLLQHPSRIRYRPNWLPGSMAGFICPLCRLLGGQFPVLSPVACLHSSAGGFINARFASARCPALASCLEFPARIFPDNRNSSAKLHRRSNPKYAAAGGLVTVAFPPSLNLKSTVGVPPALLWSPLKFRGSKRDGSAGSRGGKDSHFQPNDDFALNGIAIRQQFWGDDIVRSLY